MENYQDQPDGAVNKTLSLISITSASGKESENGHTDETKYESVIGDEVEKQGDSAVDTSGKRAHAVKVGVLDVSLFGADVMSDGVQVATYYRHCTKGLNL